MTSPESALQACTCRDEGLGCEAEIHDYDPIPHNYVYLSFATDDEFLGAVVVEAPDVLSAVEMSHVLGINPGGQVMMFDLGSESGPLPLNTLLSRADMEAIEPGGKNLRELEDEGFNV